MYSSLRFQCSVAAAALASTLALAAPSFAGDLAAPTGDVLLTVSGNIGTTNVDATAQFDLEMLRSVGSDTIQTTTIWTEGDQQFVGVYLKAILDTLGVTEGTVRASAINDYSIEIPVADVTADAPMIAYENNGSPMSIRDKGPLWIVYPYDSAPEYQTEVIYSRSIWQLDRLEILE